MVKKIYLGVLVAVVLISIAAASNIVTYGNAGLFVQIDYPSDLAISPVNVSYFNYSIPLLVGQEITNCNYLLNGVLTNLGVCNNESDTINFVSSLSDGNYNLVLNVYATQGYQNSTSDFTVDTTPPITQITAPLAGSKFMDDFIVSRNDSDATSGLDSCDVRIVDEGGSDTGWVDVACNSDYSVDAGDCPSENESSCTVWIRAIDNAGHNATDSRSFTMDYTAPVITLLGENPMNISVFETYFEPGAIAEDNIDGNVTGNIIVNGSVNGNIVGSYVITYAVSDEAGNVAVETRTVNVVDEVSPEISIIGDNPQVIEVGESYVEFNASASDNYDGDISDDIIINSSGVDTSEIGEYFVCYYVEDSSGNNDEKCRNVSVIDTVNPVVILTDPENNVPFPKTDIVPEAPGGIQLSYIVTDLSDIQYCNLTVNSEVKDVDYSVTNGTEESFFFLNNIPGKYYWNVTCVDAGNNVDISETRTFTVLSDMNFGNNTNYTDLENEENISSVEYFYVQNEYGMINWTGPLDLSRGFDWSQCISITQNNASVDSVMCPEFDDNARVELYNLTWNNPRVLINGAICSSSVCTEVSYIGLVNGSGGIEVFDVTGFSAYTTDETPIIVVQGGGGGGSSSSSSCMSEWVCSEWSDCVGGVQERTCELAVPDCTPANEEPSATRACRTLDLESDEEIPTEPDLGEEVSEGAFSAITGAVVGVLSAPALMGVVIFMLLIGGAYVALRVKKGKAIKEAEEMSSTQN